MNNTLNEFFKHLGEDDLKYGCISGTISIKVGQLAKRIVHVCGKHYSFMSAPEYYACFSFYANCSFADACSKKLMPIYNKKNADKIHKFSSLEQLKNFINSN